jgi:phospholipid transport system transporter-binding protein
MSHIAEDKNVLMVSGELNFETVVGLWRDSLRLLMNRSECCFDFSKVTSSNSAGVVLLLEWAKYAKRKNKSFRFEHIPAQLMSIVQVSGIGKILNLS